MQLTAIGTVAITIVLLGAFLFVRAAMAGFGDRLNQIEISVYLKPTHPQSRSRRSTPDSSDPRVLSVDYVSKKQGLSELRARTRGEIDTSLLTENPLPDKLRVRVRQPEHVPAVAASVAASTASKRGLRRNGRPASAAARQRAAPRRHRVIVVFLFVAGIIISNTIRLTVFARRREIAIMQLVGATNTYIRMPFICEGPDRRTDRLGHRRSRARRRARDALAAPARSAAVRSAAAGGVLNAGRCSSENSSGRCRYRSGRVVDFGRTPPTHVPSNGRVPYRWTRCSR